MNRRSHARVMLGSALSDTTGEGRAGRWMQAIGVVALRFREDRLGLTAASLTFTTLISLVPLVTVMLWVFSASPMFSSFEDALRRYFVQSLVPPSIAGPVLAALTEFSGKASRLGAVGLGFLLLAALGLMLTIDRTLNAIWRVQRPRPIGQRVLVYWTAATLGPLLLGASLSFTSYAITTSRGVVGFMPGGLGGLLAAFEFASLGVGLAGLFHYVPNARVRWRDAGAGGLVAACGLELAKRLLAWYFKQVPTYSVLYGAFATLPIFLVWLYAAWVIVLLGAVVAACLPLIAMRGRRWPDVPGAEFSLSVALLAGLEAAREAPSRGETSNELASRLHTDPSQVDTGLASLIELDWVGRLDEAGEPRYVLVCDPGATLALPLIASQLMQRAVPWSGVWRRIGLDRLTLRDLLAP